MPTPLWALSLHGFIFLAPYSHSFCGSAASPSGQEAVSKDFVPDDLEVQDPGRAFLVTGGNSSIGRATAIKVAKQGFVLVRGEGVHVSLPGVRGPCDPAGCVLETERWLSTCRWLLVARPKDGTRMPVSPWHGRARLDSSPLRFGPRRVQETFYRSPQTLRSTITLTL